MKNLTLILLFLAFHASAQEQPSLRPPEYTDVQTGISYANTSRRMMVNFKPFLKDRVEIGMDLPYKEHGRCWIYTRWGYGPASYGTVDYKEEVTSFANFDLGLAYKYLFRPSQLGSTYLGLFTEYRQASRNSNKQLNYSVNQPEVIEYIRWDKESAGVGALLGREYRLNHRFGLDMFVSISALYHSSTETRTIDETQSKWYKRTEAEFNWGIQLNYNFTSSPLPPRPKRIISAEPDNVPANIPVEPRENEPLESDSTVVHIPEQPIQIEPAELDTTSLLAEAIPKEIGKRRETSFGLTLMVPTMDIQWKKRDVLSGAGVPESVWTKGRVSILPSPGFFLLYGSISSVRQIGGSNAAELALGIGGLVMASSYETAIVPVPSVSVGYKWTGKPNANGERSVFRMSTGLPELFHISFGLQRVK